MRHKLLPSLALVVLSAIPAMPAQTGRTVPSRAVERINKEVRHEILTLPFYDVFDNITWKVEGYNVTLGGYVTRPTLKSTAENLVKQIEGVEKVVNNIEVLPPSTLDDDLRQRLYRAIYGFSALTRYAMPVVKPIRIIVKKGDVILEGVVDREADKSMVGLRANGVPGAFSVKNNLVVRKG